MSLMTVKQKRVANESRKAFNRKIAKRLQDQRGRRSQEVFSRSTTVTQQMISRYERGQIPSSWLFLAELRRNEGLDLNELLAFEGPGRNGK